MRRFDGLAALAQIQLHEDAFSGHVFVFRGRRGEQLSMLVAADDVGVKTGDAHTAGSA